VEKPIRDFIMPTTTGFLREPPYKSQHIDGYLTSSGEGMASKVGEIELAKRHNINGRKRGYHKF